MVVVILFLAGAAAVCLVIIAAVSEVGDRPSQSLPMVVGGSLLMAVLIFLAGFIVRVAFRQDIPRLGSAARRRRLQEFVAANPPMTLVPEVAAPEYPGIPFRSTIRPVIFDIVRTKFRFPVEIGNLRYMGTVGNIQAAIVRGYMRIPLGRSLPNMLLLSTRDRDNSAIPVTVRGDQVITLEGDFGRYFTLYVPRQYERDALYVFTPDFMALLIDEATQFDIEIVDSWLQIYSHRPFPMDDPETYLLAKRLADLLGAKATRQSARYSDDRAPLPQIGTPADLGDIGAQGRRLHTAAPITILVTAIAAAGGVLASFFLH